MPNVNPVYTTQGGWSSDAVYSGQVAPKVPNSGRNGAFAVGSDVMFQSGGGRLNAIIPHQPFLSLSGVQANFYDAAAPVSGGPLFSSGHIPLGGLPAGWGVSGQITPAGQPIPLNVPFHSGLCLNSASGQPGITVMWTSEDVAKFA